MRKSLCLLASVAIALLSGCHGLVVVKASTSGSPAGAGARASGASSFENCPNCSLVLKSDGGSVVAKAVSKNDVAVSWVESSSAAAEFKRIHVTAVRHGNTISVTYKAPDSPISNDSVRFAISAPAGTHLDLDTSAGSITITGFAGVDNARTGAGGIAIQEIHGPVTVHSDSGDIEAMNVYGALRAHTGSGSIRASGVLKPQVVAESGAGGIDIAGVDGSAQLQTSSGTIRADGRLVGANSIKTGSGPVEIDLKPGSDVKVDASSQVDPLDNDFNLKVDSTVTGGSMTGAVGLGDGSLHIETDNGGITIHRR